MTESKGKSAGKAPEKKPVNKVAKGPAPARTRRRSNPVKAVEGHIGGAQGAAQQLQKAGYDLTAARRLEPALDEVKGSHESWQSEFEWATRDGLYELVAKMVDFAWKMEADKDAAYALFLHRGVDMKKKYANKWTRFIALVCGEFKNRTQSYQMYNTTTLEPRDYRFAYVIRYFMDHQTPANEVVEILKQKGIAGVIEDDRAFYADPEAAAKAKADKLEAAENAMPRFTVTAPSTHKLPQGFQELVVQVVGQEIRVYGARTVDAKDGEDRQKKEAAQENRVISYIAKHFAEPEDDGVVTELFSGIGKAA